MRIKEIFLELTTETTVPNAEHRVISIIQSIIPHSYLDQFGNLHCHIGISDTLFVSHLDNYCSTVKKVRHKFDKEFVTSDRTTILGADDKAGVTVMLNMIIHKIPGHYAFFKAEEHGCLGSLEYKKAHHKELSYRKCVAFDRRGYSEIVTCQNNINTATLDFANCLSNQFKKHSNNKLQYYASLNGAMTDSNSFKYIIPECVNIAVGYFNNHSFQEKQDLIFLQTLSDTVLKIDWQNLPIFREIPNLSQIAKFEKLAIEKREKEDIQAIEKELGFSLY